MKQRLAPVLEKVGVTFTDWKNWELLRCLLSHRFTFASQQMTSVGNAVVESCVAEELLRCSTNLGLRISAPTARQILSCAANHFSCRLAADDCGLSTAFHDNGGALEGLLEDSLRSRSVQGTSFSISSLRCGQSSVGWKLSHLIGCIFVECGETAAHRAVNKLWGFNEKNFFRCILERLSRMVERYPAPSVAHAILAAQGIVPQYTVLKVENQHMQKASQSPVKLISPVLHTGTEKNDGWLQVQRADTAIPAKLSDRVCFNEIGQFVCRQKFVLPIKDPHVDVDTRKGIPIEIGEPLNEYLSNLCTPHQILFQVSMKHPTYRTVLGEAIDHKFSQARYNAAASYLKAVAADIESLLEQDR